MIKEKIIAFIASVKEREAQLNFVIDCIYNQIDKIHLVLNWYQEIPKWILAKNKIHAHLNPFNQNAHDSVWQYVEAEAEASKLTGQDHYVLIMDDDLSYPADYVEKLIATIEKYKRQVIVTVHGANIKRPVESYLKSRIVFGYSSRLFEDIFVDMVGVGTVAFNFSTIRPTPQDFPIVFMRDLWFSILAAKQNIKIVSVARPVNWITPLVTSGDTVYNVTCRNKRLQQLKNITLKEIFAPLLFCDKNNDKYFLATDYDFNEELMRNSLTTLNNVVDCNKIIFSNKVKDYSLSQSYNVLTQYVVPEEVEIGRCGSRIITQYRFIESLKKGTKVICGEGDLHFLKDPYTAFEQEFDIAVTTRQEKYQYPINSGVVMMRASAKLNNFLDYIISQVTKRTWSPLIDFQKKFNHIGNDWYIDQDIWCTAWLERKAIEANFGIKIIDIGYDYNFCPHADGASTEVGKQKLLKAHKENSVTVLHLKSRLKELLLDGLLK